MPVTVEQLLRDSGLALAEARLLLANQLGAAREQLVAHPEWTVAADAAQRFEQQAARRRAGEPIAYLLGRREFFGRWFRVTRDVLVPRPETELLVETALGCLTGRSAPRVLELGTGSGCIAISIALERPDAVVVATDISAPALAIARSNSVDLGAAVRWIESDWYRGLDSEERFDVIVSNPPYVAAGDAHLADLTFEPQHALTDGGDGLRCLADIVRGAPARLRQGGCLAVEHGHDQAEAVRALFSQSAFGPVRSLRDAAGIERVTVGSR